MPEAIGALKRFADWTAGQTGVRAAILAFLMGALLPLAFAPFYFLPMMVASFTIMAWLLDGAKTWRRAFGLGWFFGFGQFLTGLIWIANAFALRDGTNYSMGVAAVILLAVALAFFPAGAFAVAQRIWSPGAMRVWALALVWVLFEYLRGHLFTGLPWNLAGHALTFHPIAMQSAAYLGSYGLSFLAVVLASAPAAMVARGKSKLNFRPLVAMLGALIILGIFGAERIRSHDISFEPDLAVLLVQANIQQQRKWQPEHRRDNFHRHIEMTRAALDQVEASRVMVVWPETAIAYPPDEQLSARYLISKALDRPGIVFTGSLRFARNEDGDYDVWNSLFAIDNEGRLVASYDKSHLVPFGEYMPFAKLAERLGLEKFIPGDFGFSEGSGPVTLDLNGWPSASPLICYEVIFPGKVVARGPRPQWLLNITNDAWYGDSHGPYQHFSIAKLRAVEEGLPLIRTTSTGITALINPLGVADRSLSINQSGVLVSPLPKPLITKTLYSYWRDWPIIAVLSFIAAVFVAQRPSLQGDKERSI